MTTAPTLFPKAMIQGLARSLYGLDVRARALPGYQDHNFLLDQEEGRRWLLKIADRTETPASLELMNRAMEHVARRAPALAVPRVCSTLDGERIATIEHEGKTRLVRLLTYLEGTPWAALEGEPPAVVNERLGRFLGTLDLALSDFTHPAMHRLMDWDPKQTLDLRPAITGLAGEERDLVKRAFDRFELHVEPLLGALRASVIHCDANISNVLLTAEGSEISGLIDFGDVVYTPTVCEIAIALASVMMDREDPLAVGCQVLRGYHAVFPLEQVDVDVLFDLVLARLAGGLVLFGRDLRRDPGNAHIEASLRPFRDLLEVLSALDPQAVCERLGEACDPSAILTGRSPAELLESRGRHLGPSLSVSYQKHLKMVRASGAYMIDDAGRAYLDAINNVNHVGHCHPKLVAAAHAQSAVLNTNTRYLHDGLADYTERLTATLPDPLEVCFLVNSGSEANDLALRLARTHTGHFDAIVVDGAYHGTTTSVMELSSYKFDGPGGTGVSQHVQSVPTPDVYRGPIKASDPAAGPKYARDVLQALQRARAQGRQVAAFFCESMLSCGGQVILPEGYLRETFRHVRDAGGVCVADEVQVGFGRAGSHFWAFETQGVVPDIVTLGKPIGNGHPVSAVVTTREIADSFATGMEYFNTFGGNPVSCAVGLAVLDVIKEEGLQENARVIGDHLLSELSGFKGRHPLVGDVRGHGLFLGVELVRDHETLEPAREEATAVLEAMRDAGILLSSEGPHHNILKIKPPMVWTKRHADLFVEALDRVLKELHSSP